MSIDSKSATEKFVFPETRGERTKRMYPQATFEAFTCLSMSQVVSIDRIRRDFLGGMNPAQAESLSYRIADLVANCRVRIAKAPKWFEEADWGGALKDPNILVAIADLASKVEADALGEDEKAAEQIAKDLASGELKIA